MTEEAKTAPVEVPSMFNALDRCDRCGAQAHMRSLMPSGVALLFCGHHGNEYRAGLIAAGGAIETDL